MTDPVSRTTFITFIVSDAERDRALADDLYRAMKRQFENESASPADCALLLERCLRLSEQAAQREISGSNIVRTCEACEG
jgi:hypothetical protein